MVGVVRVVGNWGAWACPRVMAFSRYLRDLYHYFIFFIGVVIIHTDARIKPVESFVVTHSIPSAFAKVLEVVLVEPITGAIEFKLVVPAVQTGATTPVDAVVLFCMFPKDPTICGLKLGTGWYNEVLGGLLVCRTLGIITLV